MPVNIKYIASFEANSFFHVLAKATGNNILFSSDNNRLFFLNKYSAYSTGYFETYSYTLLDNHVHWLIKCNSHEGLQQNLASMPSELLKGHQKKFIRNEITFEEAIEFQLKDFFISYAMAFNKENNRQGSLFINPFRRIKVVDNNHFTQPIIYHHANVLKHLGQKNFQDYKWSSYRAIISDKPTNIKREEILDWFGGKDNFIKTHLENSKYFYEHGLSME